MSFCILNKFMHIYILSHVNKLLLFNNFWDCYAVTLMHKNISDLLLKVDELITWQHIHKSRNSSIKMLHARIWLLIESLFLCCGRNHIFLQHANKLLFQNDCNSLSNSSLQKGPFCTHEQSRHTADVDEHCTNFVSYATYANVCVCECVSENVNLNISHGPLKEERIGAQEQSVPSLGRARAVKTMRSEHTHTELKWGRK